MPNTLASINALQNNESCSFTIPEGLNHTRLRAHCSMLGLMRNCIYYVRKTDTPGTYTIQRRSFVPVSQAQRNHYPYDTMRVGDSFRIPRYQESSANALRVYTHGRGVALKRRFSVNYNPADQDYIITRKA